LKIIQEVIMEEREHEYECKDEKTGKKKPCPENEPGIHRESGRFTIFGKRFKFSFWYFLIILIVMYLINSFFVTTDRATAVEYNLFKEMVSSGEIERVEIQSDYYIGYSKSREKVQQGDTSPVYTFSTYIINDPAFIPLLDEKGVEYYAVAPKQPSIFSTLLGYVAPLLIFFLIWRFVFSRMGQSGGQGVLSFNQNKAKIVAEGDTGIRFKDVAGVDESKAELEEVGLGVRFPKGSF
jgi:cell division protease FtsH